MRSFLFLANGFEEIEALTTVDVMRRAGMDVKTVSINADRKATGAHGVIVTADATFNECDFDGAEWLILPGGMPGATNLHEHTGLAALLKAQAIQGKIAAICAAPAVVLAPLGILKDREATCYPGFEQALNKAKLSEKPVAIDDNIITANGPAAATGFGLAIVAMSKGEDVSRTVAEGMLLYSTPQPFFF